MLNRYLSGDGKLVVGCVILAEFSRKVWVGGEILRFLLYRRCWKLYDWV